MKIVAAAEAVAVDSTTYKCNTILELRQHVPAEISAHSVLHRSVLTEVFKLRHSTCWFAEYCPNVYLTKRVWSVEVNWFNISLPWQGFCSQVCLLQPAHPPSTGKEHIYMHTTSNIAYVSVKVCNVIQEICSTRSANNPASSTAIHKKRSSELEQTKQGLNKDSKMHQMRCLFLNEYIAF